MIRWLLLGGWLTILWAALWGEFSPANLISGALVAVLVLVLFPTDPVERRGKVRPLGVLRYVGFFCQQLITANVQVAWEVVTPRNRQNEGIIAIPMVTSVSETVLTMVVNTIGLTPGTMVIDLTETPRVLYVHVLHLDDIDAERANLMRFQELAVKAFGSDEAVEEFSTLSTRPGGAR